MPEHLPVGGLYLREVLGKGVAHEGLRTAASGIYVEQAAQERLQCQVVVGQVLPLLLIEWSEVVSVILKEGRLPIAAHQRVPVLVAPVSVVADAYVLGGGMPAGLHDGNAQRERPLRTVDETAVAQGLPPIVVAHLCQSLSGVQQGAVV